MNIKFLGKILVVSVLVLIILGIGLYFLYLGLDINKVVKIVKVEENMIDG